VSGKPVAAGSINAGGQKPSGFIHELGFEVRDYECDLQGIVNNAVYQHYLDHARQQFLLQSGVDFAALHERGLDLVVTRAELDYKTSLKSRDCFTARLRLERSGSLRFSFVQEIRRDSDSALCAQAVITGVCLDHGRPVRIQDVPELNALQLLSGLIK